MIQIVPRESPHRSKHLDNCLQEVKTLLYFHESGVADSDHTFRVGNMVLIPIIGYYPVYGLLDNKLVKEDNSEEFIKVLKAKLRYYTGYLHENYPSGVKFSLYPCPPKTERYYLDQGYLPMKIGTFDWKTYNKYAALITND